MVTQPPRPKTTGLLLVLLLAAGCSSPGPRAPAPADARQRAPVPPRASVDSRTATASTKEFDWFREAWSRFVAEDPAWPEDRREWLARGGTAPTLLSENLFRYFWGASKARRRDKIGRVANEVKYVGEPAVAYFVKALVTDRWPLKEPMTVEVFNPDNPKRPFKKTYTHYDIDDVTRQHASYVLAAIGDPAVPVLASPSVLGSSVASARRYGAYALGAIGSDSAVQALGRMLSSSPSWQDRGAAAKALGFALRKNPAARPLLEQALSDGDDFVRRKAKEGLKGESRIEY